MNSHEEKQEVNFPTWVLLAQSLQHAVLVICNKGTRECSRERLVLGSMNAF